MIESKQDFINRIKKGEKIPEIGMEVGMAYGESIRVSFNVEKAVQLCKKELREIGSKAGCLHIIEDLLKNKEVELGLYVELANVMVEEFINIDFLVENEFERLRPSNYEEEIEMVTDIISSILEENQEEKLATELALIIIKGLKNAYA